MSNTISLTVATDDYNALTRASDMLHGLALDLNKQTVAAATPELQEVVQSDPVATAEAEIQNGLQFLAHIDGVDVYSDTQITLAQHSQLTAEQQNAHNGRVVATPVETTAEGAFQGNAPATPAATATPAEPVQTTTAPTGVDLDKDGLPWDERIHAGTKTKKADGCWKAKRGVDKDVVVQVEAELRAAMSIPVPNATPAPAPVVDSQPTTPTTPAPVAPADPTPAPAPVPNVAAPTAAANASATTPASAASPATTPTPQPAVAPVAAPDPAVNPAGITTLPQLMQAATGAGRTPEEMLAAAQGVGLQSMALLGARPDLVPAVAAALGLGG